jgi:hypothetical protein
MCLLQSFIKILENFRVIQIEIYYAYASQGIKDGDTQLRDLILFCFS